MNRERRRFLEKAVAAGVLLPFRNMRALAGVVGEALTDARAAAQLAADPLRPQFHLLPKRNWMNDPNGPIYWKGQYHMFFQYNPNAAVWGDMHWAHASSPDMIHWKHLPVALAPTPGGYDAEGCFSGSAVDDAGQATIIYTGVKTVNPEEATLRDGTHNFLETQCLATATDDELRSWRKLAKPVLEPPKIALLTGFRDPCLWREGKTWYMGVGSGVRGKGGWVLLYRSRDLHSWEYVRPLATGNGNGRQAADPVDSGEMWECPDFFPLGRKWVLLYSTERKVYWQSGEFDGQALMFHPEKQGMLDHGAFYAPKSQVDAKGRRILWGWIPEMRPEAEFSAAGWAGCMSLPRELTLDGSGALRMAVIPELSGLRDGEMSVPGAEAGGADKQEALEKMRLQNVSLEIELRWKTNPVHLKLTDGTQEIFAFGFDSGESQGELQIDGGSNRVGVEHSGDGRHAARIFLDGSVAECFVDGAVAWTTRMYKVPRGKLRMEIPNEVLGSVETVKVWPLRRISADRLTS